MGRVRPGPERRDPCGASYPKGGLLMVRRYADPLVVQTQPDGTDGSGVAPVAFTWRGRRYAVRTVLAQWRERRAWWGDALDPAPGQPPGIASAAQELPGGGGEATTSSGKNNHFGVFGLSCEPATLAADTSGIAPWGLARVVG